MVMYIIRVNKMSYIGVGNFSDATQPQFELLICEQFKLFNIKLLDLKR